MSIYTKAESGSKVYRSRFNINERKILDADYYTLYPVMAKFCLPGDIWKLNINALIRYQPMLAPSLTPVNARFRAFFVPLRLVEENTELIITGSKDGHYDSSVEIPAFNSVASLFDTIEGDNNKEIKKGSLLDIMFGMPVGNYANISDADKAAMPAEYWVKGFCRLWWDYYRDENLFAIADFNELYGLYANEWHTWRLALNARDNPLSVFLPKDYFTSSLPWQLKGIAPVVPIQGTGTVSFNQVNTGYPFVTVGGTPYASTQDIYAHANTYSGGDAHRVALGTPSGDGVANTLDISSDYLNSMGANASMNVGGFSADELRAMMAQTRIFERLARTGSRYTEYLRANFNTSPSDGTLQRAQYLGGFRIPIVTTEVVQTAGATTSSGGNSPVGTLRGHGISNGGDTIAPYHVKEFGMLYVTMDIRPKTQYTQGIPREYTYKSRFDFFNPSFQHLSEQEVRNGEVYFDLSDGKNSDTFGFQAYANELRTGKDMIVGDMRDTLAYWQQAIDFPSRPNLNEAFIKGTVYAQSWHKPFAVTDGNPMVVDFGCHCDVYRPMVRYGTPGLVDHL